MKKITFFVFALSVLLGGSALSQTIVGNCSQVIVTSMGSTTPRTFRPELNLIKRNSFGEEGDNCSVIYPSRDILLRLFNLKIINVIRFTLIDVNTQQSIQVVEDTNLPTFDNMPHGTYRVRIEHLGERLDGTCPNATPRFALTREPIPFIILLTIPTGFGIDADYQNGVLHNTNTVVVGATEPSDLQVQLKDDNMHPVFDNYQGFDFSEDVKIDMTQSKNYDQTLMSIQEFIRPVDGSMIPNRWRGNNGSSAVWVPGKRGVVNIKNDIWKAGSTPLDFLTANHSYRAQVVISNSNCPSWIDAYLDFLVCPDGWNCRLGKDDIGKWSIAPNPVNNQFQIQNLDLRQFKEDKLTLKIYDLTGREVKVFQQITNNAFNVNDLNSGIYMVTLNVGKDRIYTSKLAISK